MFNFTKICNSFLSLIYIVFTIPIVHANSVEDRIVILVPFDPQDRHDGFVCPHPGNFWHTLQEECGKEGYHLTTRRDHDPSKVIAIIDFNAHCSNKNDYPSAKKILYTWEPPIIFPANFNPDIHAQYDIVMTFQDELIDNKKFRKFNYALAFSFPNDLIPFQQKKLCCMFTGSRSSGHPNQLYSKRHEIINFFETHPPEKFDFYGPGWSGHFCHRGYVQDIYGCMKHYKFAFAYENTKNLPGYISEKIFNAFTSGCVPVYWGAPNISDYVPSNCFINGEDFQDCAKLFEFLESISEEQYNEYLTNISAFLDSDKAQLFSREHFIKVFIDVIKECDNEVGSVETDLTT